MLDSIEAVVERLDAEPGRQPDALELAGRPLRNLVEKANHTRHFEGRQTLAGPRPQLGNRHGGVGAHLDRGADFLAQLRVRHRKAHSLPDGWMGEQHFIDLAR
jgi:hypothetical protein